MKTRWMEHESASNNDIRDEIFRLLMEMKAGESICPTDAARGFGSKWRQLMPQVREVVTDMARDGQIEVTLRGELVDVEEVDLESIKGPLRLRLAPKTSE
ncbi:MAG: DUF3253 domain-containing protein [Planctomycetota bacterium]|jgi:hypothetical protein